MKTNLWKRALCMCLTLAMLVSFAPFAEILPKAEAAVAANHITMPITIRDYAADGMLFEFNQVGASGTLGAAETSTHTIAEINPSYRTWINNLNAGVYIVTYNGLTQTGPWGAGLYAHMAICDANGNVKKVLGYGEAKGANSEAKAQMQSGWYVVWCFNSAPAYSTLSAITSSNMGKYKLTYSGSTLTVSVASTGTVYHQGDTAGFSLLATGTADHINNLTDSASIPGTTLLQNGSWGLETDPDPVTTTLNSGAKQKVYGAWIRTDLVQPELVNGKMVYTQAAVDYLANYMSQIMVVPEKNADGSYNTYFVKGHKLAELDDMDLAAKIRAQVTGGLGTYADAKAKYDAGNLSAYTDISTWYDAAYFLLHNTFDDSVGYGKTVDSYKSLHLVQTTNADGEPCYVFNSGYDDTKYDYQSGEIYNTQTSNITVAKTNSGEESYVRGNALPEARFDPLGKSGAGADLGYGMSGDTYGDMISPSTADWNTFYDNTNYNLSLEGHAKFIYYEDSNMYFTFTGDDDVYLFINGKRVLDVGAAHSISKVKIYLNDVAEMCGLTNGKAYDFDFFYMERHGTAANFGIETNIQILDPSMMTTKTGYQNGVSTGYNGFVDPNSKVGYSFELQNNGDAAIQNLTFNDSDIGVSFTPTAITLNSDSNINEMYAILYNADGSIKTYYSAGQLTEDVLKTMLATGLQIGEKIGIYGFKYLIPESKWTSAGTFPNTVYTTAISTGDNTSTQTLSGIANWQVQKRDVETDCFHVYDWVGKDVKDTTWTTTNGVTVNKDELIQPLLDVAPEIDAVKATIALCSASGSETAAGKNPNAVLNSDESIVYTGTDTGVDTVYYKIKGVNNDSLVLHYHVYTYGAVNNTYVLDYGLSVELNGADFGLMNNDTTVLAENSIATTAKVTGIADATSHYGDFSWNDPSLKYTPDDIIDNIDTVNANVQILEDGATELTKFTGVVMTETVTTAPASVVYYEENFPGITYVNEGENSWAHYETVDDDGNSVAGTEQSADQDSNYGSDPNYESDKVGTIVSGDSVGTVVDKVTFNLDTTNLDTLQSSGIDALNQYLGLGGSDSNGTVNELVVNTTAEVMYFEFVGTGFEIISRTTDEQYAVINVQVQKKNDDGTYTVVKQKPVITESKGGDLYQVPIISITGLEKDEYRVVVSAAGSTETKTRVLYIDGIRIYGPLDDGSALEYYNPEEYQAEIFEVKQMIQNGQMIYADASETDDDLLLVTGTTLIEDVEAYGLLTSIESVEDYMTVGPNNELYLDGNSATGMIAFFLTPDADTPTGARTLEIGAHRKSDSMYEDNGEVYMTYASTAQDIIDGTNTYTISSGTEMYYSIDVNNLVQENGKYLVMIGTNGSENYFTTLALTNLKVAGYEISFAESAVMTAYTAGDLMSTSLVSEPAAVFAARRPVVEEAEPVETEPVETEPVETEPTETEPTETEPAATDPAVSEPSEPAATDPAVSEPVETEPVETEPPVTLTINSAALKAAKVVSGKVATLTVKTTVEGASITVTDAEGNEMEPVRSVVKANGDIVTFTFIWEVTGSRGDALDFTVRAYDAEGRPSLNEETVTVTIK